MSDNSDVPAPSAGDCPDRIDDNYDCHPQPVELDADSDDDTAARDAAITFGFLLLMGAVDRHRKACQWLRVDMDKVSPDVLALATLSTDPAIQTERLKPAFEACGLIGEGWQGQREDFIRCVAERAPRNVAEMRQLFALEMADRLTLRSAGMALSPGASPQAVVQLSGSFTKLSALTANLNDQFEAGRRGDSPVPRELHGHLHVHPVLATGDPQPIEGASQLTSVTSRQPPIAAQGDETAAAAPAEGEDGADLGRDLL